MGQGMTENGRVGKQGRQDAELDGFFELNAEEGADDNGEGTHINGRSIV